MNSGSVPTNSQSAQTTVQTAQTRSTLGKPKPPPPHPKPPKDVDAPNYILFGDAVLVSPGNNSPTAAQATSTGPNGYGGVDFNFPAGLTVAQLNTLMTDYQMTVGSCGLGSPRFGVTVNSDTGPTISIYLGPPPGYNACPPNVWSNSGNLASPTNLVDASQLGGGFYEPYAAVQAAYGSDVIFDIALYVDGPTQTAQFDNVVINSQTTTFEAPPSAASCKDGGWMNFTSNPGPFKNQGYCEKYFKQAGDGDNDKDDKGKK